MQFFLMGSVRAQAGSQWVPLGRRQERCLLGLLLLECNRPVRIERLADLLWDGVPPSRARAAIQTYMSRLRTRLAPYSVRIDGGFGGYRIDVDPQDVDIHRLDVSVAAASAEVDPFRRLAILRDSLASCRGPLLDDVASSGLRERVGAYADDLMSTAVELCAEAELAVGNPERAIALAQPTALGPPVRERLVAVLMEAYRISGRKAETVAIYHAARRVLVDELGLEPDHRLRHLYAAVLREDYDSGTTVTVGIRGAQLPAMTAPFAGRMAAMAELDRWASDSDGPRSVVVCGGAGLGKTALVVRWAHQRADEFSDGQIYVDMQGFGVGVPTTATEAMTSVLLALGVESTRIPAESAAVQPLYRKLTAARRLVIVFDDVASAEQVRPALPTGPHAVALITSRRRLLALTALGEAHALQLAPLSLGDALDLMFRLLPEHRHNQAVLSDLAELCGYVPLFLRVSAANVRLSKDPASFAAAMHGSQALDYLQAGADPAVSARSALTLSYQSLPALAGRLFRAAGCVPARFVTPESAGVMLSVDLSHARWLLDRIADVHLIEQVGFCRYQLHDLIRGFAAEQEPSTDDDAMLPRLLSFYVEAVAYAAELGTANGDGRPPSSGPTGLMSGLHSPAAAMRWLDDELPNLVSIVQHAAEHGPQPVAWQIARKLTQYFWIRRSMPEWRAINEAALAAARAVGGAEAIAPMLTALAVTLWTTNDLSRSGQLLEEALSLNTRLKRSAGLASNHTNLGSLYRQIGRLPAALAHTKTAIRLGRRHERRLTVANALLNLSFLHRDMGALYRATTTTSQALAIYRELNSTDGEISSLNDLASTQCELGNIRHAATAVEQSLAMADAFGSVHGAVFARIAMTDLLVATGRAADSLVPGEAALDRAMRQGDCRLIISALLGLASARSAARDDEAAGELADNARLMAIEQRDLQGHVDALLIMAELAHYPNQALAVARTAERKAAEAGLLLRKAKAQQITADVLMAAGDAAAAYAAAEQAWPMLCQSGAKVWISRSLVIRRAHFDSARPPGQRLPIVPEPRHREKT